MKYILFFFLLIGSFFSAQRKEVKVINLSPKTELSVFPLVKMKNNPRVAEKINMYLQISELEIIPNSTKKPFEKVIQGTTSYHGYRNFYDWQMLSTPKKYFEFSAFGRCYGCLYGEFHAV